MSEISEDSPNFSDNKQADFHKELVDEEINEEKMTEQACYRCKKL